MGLSIFVRFSPKTTVLIICLHCIDKIAVCDFVYRSLAQNLSSDFFKTAYSLQCQWVENYTDQHILSLTTRYLVDILTVKTATSNLHMSHDQTLHLLQQN